MNDLLTAKEISAIWGITPDAVRRWHRRGNLRAEQHGRLLYWRLDDLYARHWRSEAGVQA